MLPMASMAAPRETFANRFYALPGLILTSLLTIILSYGSATGKSSSSGFYLYVAAHRASTQIIVQILSHILGALLVLTMVSLINFNTRLHLVARTVSLDRLTWWNQLCNQRLSFALPGAYVVALILFYGNIVNYESLHCAYNIKASLLCLPLFGLVQLHL